MRATGGGSVSKTRREMWRAYIFSRYTRDVHGRKSIRMEIKKEKKNGGRGRGGISPGATRGFLFAIFALNPSLRRIDISVVESVSKIIDFEYLREILSSINSLCSGTRVTHWLCSINFDTLRNGAEEAFFWREYFYFFRKSGMKR